MECIDVSPLPLKDCITFTSPPVHIPPPLSEELQFHKIKLLLQIKEFRSLLETTTIHLQPLFTKLNEVDAEEDQGYAAKVFLEHRECLWGWYNHLEDLYENLDKEGHKLTNAEWRKLKGALKRIGKVSFEDLQNRFSDICAELVELEITLP